MQCCLVIGDFNLDYAKAYDDNYRNKNLFTDFDEMLSEFNLVQLVNFVTWSRMDGSERRISILDHIYVKDLTLVSNLKYTDPYFGDHVLVEFIVNASKSKNVPNKCRDWRN